MRLTSTRNPVVGYVRSLERASVRRKEGAFLVEGVRLVGEAMRSGESASLVLFDPESLSSTQDGAALMDALEGWAHRAVEVDARVLAAAAQTETPAGVVAVLRRRQDLGLDPSVLRFGVILDAVSDPGNAGTILRTCDAAGVDCVIAAPGTVDLYAPKVVRAGMGAHFRVPTRSSLGWGEIEAAMRGVSLVAAAAGRGESVFAYRWPEQAALVVGSEAHGLSAEAQTLVAQYVHVPMRAGVESLNAAVAASIIIYAALQPSGQPRERYK